MIFTKIQETTQLGNRVNIVATNIMSYDLGPDTCHVRYELRYRNPQRESDAIPDNIIAVGSWDAPKGVLNAWTGSNTHLADAMCDYFGFTVVEHLQNQNL